MRNHILAVHVHVKMNEQCGICEEKLVSDAVRRTDHYQNWLYFNLLIDLKLSNNWIHIWKTNILTTWPVSLPLPFPRIHTHTHFPKLIDFTWFSGIESDVKNIPLLDRNDERMKKASETYVDQTCDICHVQLDSLSVARIHYIVEHKKQLGYFKCCRSKHYCETNLIDHLNWHVNPTIFTYVNTIYDISLCIFYNHDQCRVCLFLFCVFFLVDRCRLCRNKNFGSRRILIAHINEHKALQCKKFTCDTCPDIFPRIEDFRLHMETKHGVMIPKQKSSRHESASNPLGWFLYLNFPFW